MKGAAISPKVIGQGSTRMTSGHEQHVRVHAQIGPVKNLRVDHSIHDDLKRWRREQPVVRKATDNVVPPVGERPAGLHQDVFVSRIAGDAITIAETGIDQKTYVVGGSGILFRSQGGLPLLRPIAEIRIAGMFINQPERTRKKTANPIIVRICHRIGWQAEPHAIGQIPRIPIGDGNLADRIAQLRGGELK
jgi:hypothetical protein